MPDCSKPNILLIMTDQQSATMMSGAGNPYVRTPNMDFLARKGVRFLNTYCANPVCLPSRFSMFTGLYPSDIGLKSNNYMNEVEALPDYILQNGLGKLMNQAGYNAVYGGKEHLPHMRATDLGFENISTDERDNLAERCAEYIREYNDSKPFFMVSSFINPHDICAMILEDFAELSGKEELIRACEHMVTERACLHEAMALPKGMNKEVFFECVCPPLPDNYMPAPDEAEGVDIYQSQEVYLKLARQNYTDEQWRMHRWAYLKLTEMVDAQIGKVIDALIDSGKFDDTVIIFTSDHGDMDASHKCEQKDFLFEECCHVPLIIKGAGVDNGHSVDNRIVNNGTDCIPTILEYAGCGLPEYLSGISLKTAVENAGSSSRDESPRKQTIVESQCGLMAVDGEYKYARYLRGARAEQFFDLKENPGEMYNQINDPQYKAKLARLKAAVEEHANARPGIWMR